jgi:hypothetical protein
LEEESGVLALVEPSGNVLLEIYFKAFKTKDGIHFGLGLTATPLPAAAPETLLLDRLSFTETDGWRNLVITHVKQKVEIFVDGTLAHTGTLHYPAAKAVQLHLGKCRNRHTFYCGEIARLMIHEGLWDKAHIQRNCAKGIFYAGSLKALGIENRELLALAVPAKEAKDAALPAGPEQSSPKRSFDLIGGASSHYVRNIRELLEESSGLPILFEFFDKGPEALVASLRIFKGKSNTRIPLWLTCCYVCVCVCACRIDAPDGGNCGNFPRWENL